MDKPRPCGCKGCRTCLICEETFGLHSKNQIMDKKNSYVYCPWCNKAWTGWDIDLYKTHPNHAGRSVDYPGVFILLDFLNHKEENDLIKDLDEKLKWDLSQSGRRKQNFGPKCNFKKKKLKLGDFKGFPTVTKFVQDKFKFISILKNFQTIEQCSLEYNPLNGASIDAHIDDCWIWGERIVTVNLLADTCLTMSLNKNNFNRYNLDCVEKYSAVLDSDGKENVRKHIFKIAVDNGNKEEYIVRIPMPRRSLLVLYGAARYDWEHSVLREDVLERRICLAYREFTPPYLADGENYKEEISGTILKNASLFW